MQLHGSNGSGHGILFLKNGRSSAGLILRNACELTTAGPTRLSADFGPSLS